MSNPSFVTRFNDDNDDEGKGQVNERDIGTLPVCEVLASSGNADASELNFDKVAGLQLEKERIRSAFGRPNLAPLMYTNVPRGMLLYGPPGTGKTYLMRAFVHEIPFCILVGPDTSQFQSSYYGVPAKLIRYFFECTSKAAYNNDRTEEVAPGTTLGLLFIDELEAIGASRSAASNDPQRGTVVATILQLLQGVNSDFPNVYLVGATNLPWIIDSALLRRMPVRIFFNVPDAPARFAIINSILRHMYTPVEYSNQFTPKPDDVAESKEGAAPVIQENSTELVMYKRLLLLQEINPEIKQLPKTGHNEAVWIATAVLRRTGIEPKPSAEDIKRGRQQEPVIYFARYKLSELANYILGTVQYNGEPYRSGQKLSNKMLSFVGQKLKQMEAARATHTTLPSPPPTGNIVVRRTPPQPRRQEVSSPVHRYILDNLWKLCLPSLQISDIFPDEKTLQEEKEISPLDLALENTFIMYLLKRTTDTTSAPDPNDPIRRELRRRRLTADVLIRVLVQMSGPQTVDQVRMRMQTMGIRNPRITNELLKTYAGLRGTDLNANGSYVFGYSASDLTDAIEQGINLASDRTFTSGVRPCDPLTPECFTKLGACGASSICVSISKLDPIDRQKLQNFSLRATDMFTAFDRVRSTVVPSEYVDYLWYEKNQEKLPMAEASLP